MSSRLLTILLICFCHYAIAAENSTFSAGSVEIEFNPSQCTVQFTLGAIAPHRPRQFQDQRGERPLRPRRRGKRVVESRSM